MKTMRAKNNALQNLVVLLSLASLIGFGLSHAQETATPVQADPLSTADWDSASDLQVLLHAVEMLPTVPATTAPRAGTFWSAQHAPGTRSPWPPLPSNARKTPLWNLGDDVFLLSDLNVNYSLPPTSS